MEDLEVALHVVVNVEDGSDVTATIAVVGSGPHGDKVRILEPVLEAVHDKLMSSGHKFQVVDVIVLSCHFGAK